MDNIVDAMNADDYHCFTQLIANNPALLDMDINDGSTILDLAVIYNHEKYVELLLSMGADVNLRHGEFGDAPLHHAARTCRPRMVDILLAHGALVDVRDDDGLTPLMLVSDCSDATSASQVIHRLIAAGANINIQDNNGKTPLFWASENDNFPMVTDLVENGADVQIAMRNGWTALHAAVEIPDETMVAYLITHGADINATENKHGWTPLHYATFWGYIGMVEFLLSCHANRNISGTDGKTPLDIAVGKNDFEIATLLRT